MCNTPGNAPNFGAPSLPNSIVNWPKISAGDAVTEKS
jgi:hypothetical protein